MTGIVLPYGELTFKRLELTRELLPSARRVALLAHYPQMRTRIPAFQEELEAGARRLGLELLEADASRDGGDIAATFARVMRRKADAVLVFGEVNFQADRFEVVQAMELRHRVPMIFDVPGLGVLALGPEWNAANRRAVELGARILKGARPADIPVELENRYLMTVNLKIAAAIGLEVPRTLVLRAASPTGRGA